MTLCYQSDGTTRMLYEQVLRMRDQKQVLRVARRWIYFSV